MDNDMNWHLHLTLILHWWLHLLCHSARPGYHFLGLSTSFDPLSFYFPPFLLVIFQELNFYDGAMLSNLVELSTCDY